MYRENPDVRPTLVRAESLPHDRLTSFETVMERLLVGDPGTPILERVDELRLLDRVNEVLCYAFLTGRACAFEEKDDLYDDLFEALRPTLRAIITPNYDLLAEEALGRVGLAYRYRAMDEPNMPSADVVMDKFHGSVNFFYTPGTGTGRTVELARDAHTPTDAVMQDNIVSIYNALPVIASQPPRRANAVCALKADHEVPVLVTYGPGKDATHGRPHLNSVRLECAAELRGDPPRRVIALGISPPRGDGDDVAWESLCTQLGALDCAKDYWSGMPDEREKMRTYGFDVHDGYFDQLLRALDAESA